MIKWAIANGNWTAGTTWNDGVVPTTDDRVYLNGYVVTIDVYTIEVKELRSDSNIENNISDGGRIIMTSYTTIVCEKVVQGVVSDYFINRTRYALDRWVQINGDVYTSEQASFSVFHINSGVDNVLVNGNIYLRGGYFLSAVQKNLTVNGNIISLVQMPHPFCANYPSGGCSYTVNGIIDFGNIRFEQTENITLTINGVVKNAVLYATTSSYFSGEYQYEGQPAIKLPMNFSQDYRFVAINEEVPIIVNPNTIADTYPTEDKVLAPTQYGAQMELVGTYTPDYPPESVVLKDYEYGDSDDRKTGTLSPVVLGDYPAEADVKVGVVFDYGNKVGTFQPVADYPAEADVLQGVEYAYGQMTGTLSVATDYPQEANVLLGVEYANGSMVGTLEVVQMQADYPSEDDVRFDIVFDFGNKQGKCHVPIPEDVRDGVPVDVNGVGTLIPSSGGDRLRIADFGYYTNAQSDTYIVDLTEQDKTKFAVAEERVLIEMFPELDLDNIPDKYFDDLFVKYLKYRLIVEYYRTAGINSTFTPSEPTTEIVNYRNVNCEIWMNIANTYLKAWGEKYPNSVKKDRILL